MAEDKPGIQESSRSPQIQELKRHVRSHTSAQDPELERLSRRKFLGRVGTVIGVGGFAATAWWQRLWPFKNSTPEQGLEKAENPELLIKKEQIQKLGLVIQNYINPDFQGNFIAGRFNNNKVNELCNLMRVLPEEYNTANSLPSEQAVIDLGDLSDDVPRLGRLFASLQTTPEGKLAKVTLAGNLNDRNIPDDQLSKVAKIYFNTSSFKDVQQSNELFTSESRDAGIDANNMPILPELQIEESRRTHNGLERGALLALNPEGGFYLEVNVMSDDEMKSNAVSAKG